MAKVVLHSQGLKETLFSEETKKQLMELADKVAAEAQATASAAENGPGGRLDGYEAAGFSVVYETRSKRPRVIVKSNADAETAKAVHFYTQARDGVAHMRAALYKFTKRSE